MDATSQYQFGPFRLIPQERLLLCGGEEVHLQRKWFDLLVIMVTSGGRLLKKEQLMKQLWPNTFVEEGNLSLIICKLRKVLKMFSDQQYVETVPGHGYRFVAPAQEIQGEREISTPQNSSRPDSLQENGAPFKHLPAPQQLLAPLSEFVGREEEIAALIDILRHKGGICISGMGGVGKTALASLVAHKLRGDYPDAQFFIDLRGTDPQPRDSADALAECIRGFAKPDVRLPEDTNELSKLYRSYLSNLRALVVLDNASDSDQVEPLLPPHSCAIIITSRRTMTLPGMELLTLQQLSAKKARELFLSISPQVSPSIADQICSLCGYLPLAIRSAASLLKVTPDLDPVDYATQLRDEQKRLKLLGAESPNLDVEASLNLSYARLQPETAHVFHRLAVFPATFDALAEEVVCEDSGHQHLTELLRRNLVLFDTAARRYRLHDLVRLLAKKYLAADEDKDNWRRYAEHYEKVLRSANQLFEEGGAASIEGVALLDLEWNNIQSGQAWSAAWAEKDRAAAELCDAYPNAGGNLISLRLHPREHIRWRETAVDAARRLDRRDHEGRHLGYMGEAYRALGELRLALDCHERHLSIARETDDRLSECIALGGIGNTYDNLGQIRRALEFYEQALVIARELHDRRREARILGNVGIECWRLGDIQRALEHHQQHLAIAAQMNDQLSEAYAMGNLGLVYLDLNQIERAIKLSQQALSIFQTMGDRRSRADALINIGRAYTTIGERNGDIRFYQRAVRFSKRALTIACEIANHEIEAESLNVLGEAYTKLGNKDRVIKLYRRALDITKESGNLRIRADTLWGISLALEVSGDHEQAITSADEAYRIYKKMESPKAAKVSKQLVRWRKQR